MRLLRCKLETRPPGMTHNDRAYIIAGHQMVGMKPPPLPSRTVIYGMRVGPWRIDWYDLATERWGRPEIGRPDGRPLFGRRLV